jgi:outer membrane autotransporter protein
MTRRWATSPLVMVAIVGVAAPASAQALNELLGTLLSDGCVRLGGNLSNALVPLCSLGGAGSSSGSGTSAAETRGGDVSQAFRRLRQRQGAASADIGGQRFSVFAAVDYQKFDRDTTRFETGFDRDTLGATVGADYVFRNGLVLGAVFNYGHEFGDYDGGGDFDHDAYGILVYGSVIPIPNVFVDVAAGYTRKDYSFDRRFDVVANGVPVNGIARGDTDGNEFRIGVNTGDDFVLGRFTVGPRVGVTYRDIAMDAYRQSGKYRPRAGYDNQNIQSLTTTVGLFGSGALSTGFGVIVPQRRWSTSTSFSTISGAWASVSWRTCRGTVTWTSPTPPTATT